MKANFRLGCFLILGVAFIGVCQGAELFALRINCGANKPWTDGKGHTWEADRDFESGKWGVLGGGAADRGEIKIARTDLEPIYRTERYGMSAYRITCPDGKYRVTLHFAETWDANDSSGQRVFYVGIQGQAVLSRADPVEMAGQPFTAVAKTFETEVKNSELTIEFAGIVGNPEINGIEVIETSASFSAQNSPSAPLIHKADAATEDAGGGFRLLDLKATVNMDWRDEKAGGWQGRLDRPR